jgi:iron complex transport system ATP-binding protein
VSAALIEFDAVSLWLEDGTRLLDGISWCVEPAQHWALIGPNGSGKSTLLSIAGARRFPSRGAVSVGGFQFGRANLLALRERIGVMDPSAPMYDWFTVEEIVLTGITGTIQPVWQLYGEAERQRARAALTAVGCLVDPEREIRTCSQGERQRVRIARALINDPMLLLLDEPATGLDLPAREALILALGRLRDTRPEMATVLVTHHLEELPPTTTHALLLRGGRVLVQGPVEEALTSDHVSACFGVEVALERRHGRWTARAVPGWGAVAPPVADR